MTHLNTIFSDDFDSNITTQPSFYKMRKRAPVSVTRGVFTHHILISDMYQGTINRQLYDPDSYDAYRVVVVTETSMDDLRDILKALKKVMSQYSPSDDENIIIWEEGELTNKHIMRWEYEFNVLVKKVGKTIFD